MNRHVWLSARGLIDVENPPIAGFWGVSGNDGNLLKKFPPHDESVAEII
jgi:hypothetical protein